MTQSAPKIRLFIDAPLGRDVAVPLEGPQAHYLFAVMRQRPGDSALLFNGRDGEWQADVVDAGKRRGSLRCTVQSRPAELPPDLWLCFAPIKKARTDFIAEKACEMGCRRLIPVFTAHTNSERVNTARLRAHAIEAAEQCGMICVPDVAEPVSLEDMLADWPQDRKLMFCDESGGAPPARKTLSESSAGPWAVLTGPEGGFSPAEAARLRAFPQAHPVSLGPRILRADTAAVAALALWQSTLGDWSQTT